MTCIQMQFFEWLKKCRIAGMYYSRVRNKLMDTLIIYFGAFSVATCLLKGLRLLPFFLHTRIFGPYGPIMFALRVWVGFGASP